VSRRLDTSISTVEDDVVRELPSSPAPRRHSVRQPRRLRLTRMLMEARSIRSTVKSESSPGRPSGAGWRPSARCTAQGLPGPWRRPVPGPGRDIRVQSTVFQSPLPLAGSTKSESGNSDSDLQVSSLGAGRDRGSDSAEAITDSDVSGFKFTGRVTTSLSHRDGYSRSDRARLALNSESESVERTRTVTGPGRPLT
jgi:hypothetical protein